MSFVDAAFGGLRWRDAAAYLPAQVAGCIAGAVAANLMFAQAAVSISAKHRATPAHFLSEVIATLGLILVIFALARSGRSRSAPAAVGAYIGAAYFFTSSTSFANPAITVGRMFSDTFAGIAPSSVPAFIAAQIIGGALAVVVIRALYPRLTPAQASDIIFPHHTRPGRAPQAAQPRRRHGGCRTAARPRSVPLSSTTRRDPAMHLVMIGGSDAGISAALRARELDPGAEVSVIVADAYPNFSICGIPYYVSGEVTHWRNLAHRTTADLEATGMSLRLDTTARRIDVAGRKLLVTTPGGHEELLAYDKLVIGTGAVPVRPPIGGLDALGPEDGVHLLHSMGDTFAVMRTLEDKPPATAVIVGAGYIGLEMADALTTRGLQVIQMEQLPEVLPTVDPALGQLVHAQLADRGVEVLTGTTVRQITRTSGEAGGLQVEATAADGTAVTRQAGMVLVVVGVRPDTTLAASAGAALGARGAIAVDRGMRTNLPDVFAAGDCVVTWHRLLGETYLPLGTTAHKQGRVAGENALGGTREFAGSLGTQVVKIFDQAAARTGLRDHEAAAAGYDPVTVQSEADDHKAYYPGSHRITMRFTGDRATGRLLGVQLFGHRHAEIAKRIDIAATAIFHAMTVDGLSDLDLSYTPPLGSPWDAIQMGAQGLAPRSQPHLTSLTFQQTWAQLSSSQRPRGWAGALVTARHVPSSGCRAWR